MNVLLFSLANLGDTLLVQQIVHQVCKENPAVQFQLFTLSNSILYESIPNLQILSSNATFSKTLTSKDDPTTALQKDSNEKLLQQLRENSDTPYFLLNESTVAINLWIGSYLSFIKLEDIECDILSQQFVFQTILSKVKHHIQLNYTPLTPFELIPSLPFTPLPSFDSWYSDHKTEFLIFYYNYLGRSGQCMINSEDEHNTILLSLALQFPHSKILVPRTNDALLRQMNELHLQNIIDCRTTFGLLETPSCKNLVDIAKIQSKCNVIIQYDIGACYYFLNKEFLFNSTSNIVLHFGKRTFYIEKFKKLITASQKKIVKLIQFTTCGNWNDVLANTVQHIHFILQLYHQHNLKLI